MFGKTFREVEGAIITKKLKEKDLNSIQGMVDIMPEINVKQLKSSLLRMRYSLFNGGNNDQTFSESSIDSLIKYSESLYSHIKVLSIWYDTNHHNFYFLTNEGHIIDGDPKYRNYNADNICDFFKKRGPGTGRENDFTLVAGANGVSFYWVAVNSKSK